MALHDCPNPSSSYEFFCSDTFFPKRHTCFCCDQFAIDDLKIVTGGWPVRLVGDKGVTLFADGKQMGDRVDWWEPAKDTYRYRVDANTEIFGLRIENAKGKKMGVIGSFGDSLVTSSTWKCKSFLTDEEQKHFLALILMIRTGPQQ